MSFSVTSTVLLNQDATPISKVFPTSKGGASRRAVASLTVLATTVGQTNAFARIPVRARLGDVSARLASMGNGSVKIGFYRPGGSVNTAVAVKDDAITAAMALTAQTGASVFDGPTPANREKSIADWLATEIGTAGATGDVELDIIATVVTVSTGAATAMALEVEYVEPE